jgi:NAD(P)-dependent dehydrogenase (short-subunit alcohol dehydrogenase family)
VQKTVAALSARHPGRVVGAACDVTDTAQLEALWQAAATAFGRVDVWINNAGVSIRRVPLHQADPRDLEAVVYTNLTGMLLACRVAIAAMLKQGGGQVWNMEGFGSNGMTQPGIIPYGSTKRAVQYLTAALQKELKGTPVHACTLSPGIVVTDLLVGDYDRSSADWERVKRIFNILGDTVDTVTPFLADGVLAADRPGARVAWLTGGKVAWRFLTAGFSRRDLFAGVSPQGR